MLSEKLKEAVANSGGPAVYIEDVFSTYLYTGNGSTQTINNGIDLAGKGGMVWIKNRSTAGYNHALFNTLEGNTKSLASNTTDQQITSLSGWDLTSFNSNGFSIGPDDQKAINLNSNTYASWTFRKAAKFFDVQTVSHTNGTANTIDLSGLGTVGCVIAKITTTTGDWDVWHRSLTAGNNLQLNLTNAQSTTNAWLSVSGTTATLAAGAPTGTYVIYAYAHNAGGFGASGSDNVISCGSYTGTGTDLSGSLGYEPQYLLVKRIDLTGSWVIHDVMRGMPEPPSSSAWLLANSSQVETVSNQVTATATGFKFTSLNNAAWNASGSTYIYIAIRRPMKTPTSGASVFSPITYTGNGVSPRNITGFGFPIDLCIEVFRNQVAGAAFYDRLRGAGWYLASSSTGAETDGTLGQPSFALQDGYQVAYGLNSNTNLFAAEGFKRATGFMDVVCYTGTGSATTQTHNLGVVPELMIVKERSAANDWWVYSASLGNTKYEVLNSTATPVTSSTAWNNTTPTSSVFSIGTGANVNASAQTYVAYLFATCAGVSKVGSYTGNGSTQTINCGFTGGARFVLIKRTDSTGDWYVFDTARGMTTLTDPYLLLNSTAAEVATLGAVTSVTTGFAVNAAVVAAINTNAASYIYLSVS